LRVLVDRGVDFVVVGGLVGNRPLERLADALRKLGARLRGAPRDVPFLLDAETLRVGANFRFTTDLGSLDILGNPAGAPTYDQLRRAAQTMDFGGFVVLVGSLDHLIRMKEAAGRTKDKLVASEYRALSVELRRRPSA
jgi:hypothetical protein